MFFLDFASGQNGFQSDFVHREEVGHAIEAAHDLLDLLLAYTLNIVVSGSILNGHPREVKASFIDLLNDVDSPELNGVYQQDLPKDLAHVPISNEDLDQFELNSDFSLAVH